MVDLDGMSDENLAALMEEQRQQLLIDDPLAMIDKVYQLW